MKPNYISRLVLIIIGITMLITGIRMLVMGVDAYIQPLHHTDWVTTSANVTDISESVINGIRGGHLSSRTSINYWMTYEYEVDGTHYTGEYGPLANSIAAVSYTHLQAMSFLCSFQFAQVIVHYHDPHYCTLSQRQFDQQFLPAQIGKKSALPAKGEVRFRAVIRVASPWHIQKDSRYRRY